MNEFDKKICDNIREYIVGQLKECTGDEVFTKMSIRDLGEFYYNKVLDNIEDSTEKLLQIVIQFMLRKRIDINGKDDFYIALCKIINIKKLPQQVLIEVEKEYNEIFVQKYNAFTRKADMAKSKINTQLRDIQAKTNSIKNASPNYSLMRDLSSDEFRLLEYSNECNLLRTRKEMIEFVKQYSTSKLMGFCNSHDAACILQANKREAIKLACNDEYDVAFSFSFYKEIIEIAQDDIDRPYALFYKIKFYTATEKARELFHRLTYITSEEEQIKKCKSFLSKIPKIDDIHLQKENNHVEYLHSLKKFINDYDIINSLTVLINKSICLRDRKDILRKCLGLFNTREYELFDSIVPIQIEGMFADFLLDTTTFMRFTKMDIYNNFVLKEKIKYLQDTSCDIYPEAVEYFMFYFNNIVRNKIAHGSNKSIFKDSTQAEIFAMETLLDMNMLVYMFSRKSETEKMYRFISGYQQYYNRLIKSDNPCFGALLNDMIGDKTISEYDSIEQYRPIQVAYWLVNPYYEKIYEAVGEKHELIELRNQFLSKEFWGYVLETLNDVINTGYDYKRIHPEFNAIINGLFRCDISKEVRVLLGQVNAALQKIKRLE